MGCSESDCCWRWRARARSDSDPARAAVPGGPAAPRPQYIRNLDHAFGGAFLAESPLSVMPALVAGHETTASQLAWAFERLAREPRVVERLVREQGRRRRRCLGASFALQEMKIVVRAVLSRYEIAPVRTQSEQTARRSITFSPRDGATVVLREREAIAVQAVPQTLAASA